MIIRKNIFKFSKLAFLFLIVFTIQGCQKTQLPEHLVKRFAEQEALLMDRQNNHAIFGKINILHKVNDKPAKKINSALIPFDIEPSSLKTLEGVYLIPLSKKNDDGYFVLRVASKDQKESQLKHIEFSHSFRGSKRVAVDLAGIKIPLDLSKDATYFGDLSLTFIESSGPLTKTRASMSASVKESDGAIKRFRLENPGKSISTSLISPESIKLMRWLVSERKMIFYNY